MEMIKNNAINFLQFYINDLKERWKIVLKSVDNTYISLIDLIYLMSLTISINNKRDIIIRVFIFSI